MTATLTVPATDKQIAFIHKLIGEKDTGHFGEDTLADLNTVKAGGTLPRKFASELISALLAAPRKQQPKAAPSPSAITKPGLFVAPNGEIIKAKPNQSKTRLYAMAMVGISGERLTVSGEIVNWKWRYAPGLVAQLQESWRMPFDQAAELSIAVGKCLCCGRKLKAAKSVQAMIGPVCAGYFA